MKNVTIVLDEKVARWAKVWAAQHNTSLSRMLGEELRRKMEQEENYERSQRRFLSKSPRPLKAPVSKYDLRDAIHER